MRALLSVTNKSGIVDFATQLASLGYTLISTGGTAKALREGSLSVLDVSQVTDFPEMMDGRLKTLHPKVHGGLLGDVRRPEHRAAMDAAGIAPIEVVVVNLYAFEETVTGEHEFAEAIESIDIGGPAMIRAAAKNHPNVYVVTDPDDYERVLEALRQGGSDSLKVQLAAKAFRHTAFYDSMIARYLTDAAGEEMYTDTLTLGYRRAQPFRRGENPHQTGALYLDPLGQPGLLRAEQVWGIPLGYNNWNDADGAWELVNDLPDVACAITKHGNPCGAAIAPTFADAFRLARDADPISAFGGVVAFNGTLDLETAQALTEKGNKLDVIIAKSITADALDLFRTGKGWRQEVRILTAPTLSSEKTFMVKGLRGGALIQDIDEDPGDEWQTVTTLVPTPEQMAAMRLMWKVIPHVKSNAIVVGTDSRLLGVGAGQMNRVQSVRLALDQAGELASQCALASDAFFPFPDSVEAAAAAGIRAIVQPGGSVKDADVIARANELGIAMCFTGVRHFRH
jgi:phosphoribosylaminoimidazolecarboxamide formyltransferase/IMP cyclohydrolase